MDLIERDDVVAWIMNKKPVEKCDCERIIQCKAWKIARYIIHNDKIERGQLVKYAIDDSLEVTRIIFGIIEENDRMGYIDVYFTIFLTRKTISELKYIITLLKESNHPRADYFNRGDLPPFINYTPEKIYKPSLILLEAVDYTRETGYSLVDYIDKCIARENNWYSRCVSVLLKTIRSLGVILILLWITLVVKEITEKEPDMSPT